MAAPSSAGRQNNTRSSLLRQIKSPSNTQGWRRFFDTYGPLIERFALKSGLSPVESEEVVQNTMVRVAENIGEFEYNRRKGSFKSWLLNCARWRVVDVLRARPQNTLQLCEGMESGGHAAASPEAEPGIAVFDRIWDAEWEEHLRRVALEEVKKKSSSAHFQIFCLYVLEGLPPSRVADMVGVTVAQVYLVRCRLGRLLKVELAALRKL